MITIRTTSRAAKALGLAAKATAPPGTSPLGDWYVNVVPSAGGDVLLFMNERSLLAVVVPLGTPELLHAFVARVGNILSLIGVANSRIEEELEHFREARVGKTTNRRLLGVLRDLGWRFQEAIADATPDRKLSLSDFELDLATMPHATLGWGTAADVARSLLTSPARHGAV